MKSSHTLCLVIAALLALTGVQPSKAADADRSFVVAQRTTLGSTNEATDKAKQKALERSQQAADKAKAKAKAEAKKRADAKRKAEERAKTKAEAKRMAGEKAKARAEAKRRAEERASARAEAKAKARAEAKAKKQAEAKRKAEERAKAKAEAKRKAEERARARSEAKQKEKAEADAKRKTKAETEAKRKADKKATAEAEAQQKAKDKAEAAAEQKQREQERQRSRREDLWRDSHDSDRARRDRQEEPKQEGSRVRLGAPPTRPRDANDFIRRDRNAPRRNNLSDLRRERRETRDGDRLVIREGDRTIVRDGGRSFIRHNEADRFAVGARDVRVSRRNGETTTIVVRPNGVQIISITDRDGDLIRRVRRDSNGREIVLIDNRFAGRRGRDHDWRVDVRRPRYRGRRDRYVVDAGRANLEDILWALTAAPIATLDRRYTLEEVRYSDPLRDYMPRVDLDIHFDSGSWQLTPDQIDKLSVIARGLNRAIDRDRQELYMVEGHTDAVGNPIDNLSLSDRRAESVAIALTEGFGVPPENLVTQGYGEDYLKVPTPGPSRVNRRVAIRRITPLVAEADAR